jgi:hypothetical protein
MVSPERVDAARPHGTDPSAGLDLGVSALGLLLFMPLLYRPASFPVRYAQHFRHSRVRASLVWLLPIKLLIWVPFITSTFVFWFACSHVHRTGANHGLLCKRNSVIGNHDEISLRPFFAGGKISRIVKRGIKRTKGKQEEEIIDYLQ